MGFMKIRLLFVCFLVVIFVFICSVGFFVRFMWLGVKCR